MTYLHCSYTAPTCVYILVFMRGCGSFVYLTASGAVCAGRRFETLPSVDGDRHGFDGPKCPTGGTMIRDICRDETFLAQRAERAGLEDLETARDLLDTLAAHKESCVGMAANMIGVNKRIIVFDNEGEYMVMLNPVIVKQSGPYETEEGCLSLTGRRKTKRFQTIKVQWQNEKLQTRLKTFTGWTAEIIQHEIDHCDGILI